MQRGERGALVERCHDGIVDLHGVCELLAAVDNAMTDSVDLFHGLHNAVFLARELFDDGGDSLGVRRHGDVLVENALPADERGVLEMTVDAYALAQTLGHDLLGLHVDQLVLQGRAARIDNKNFHCIPFLSSHVLL